jgi:hypothetical protein
MSLPIVEHAKAALHFVVVEVFLQAVVLGNIVGIAGSHQPGHQHTESKTHSFHSGANVRLLGLEQKLIFIPAPAC